MTQTVIDLKLTQANIHIFTKNFHGVEIRMLLIKFVYPLQGAKKIFEYVH